MPSERSQALGDLFGCGPEGTIDMKKGLEDEADLCATVSESGFELVSFLHLYLYTPVYV